MASSEATVAPKTFDVVNYEAYSYVQSTEHQGTTKGGGGGPNEPCGAQKIPCRCAQAGLSAGRRVRTYTYTEHTVLSPVSVIKAHRYYGHHGRRHAVLGT